MVKLFSLCFCLAFLFFPDAKGWKEFKISGEAQGTTYNIKYYSFKPRLSKSEIDSLFRKLDSSLSLYKPYSLVNSFNRSDKGIVVDVHLRNVVTAAIDVFRETNGAFDITVLPLVNAWGFGPVKPESLPGMQLIDSLRACTGTHLISLEENFLKKSLPCIALDVNGIGQGYSVDVISNFVEAKGIRNYIVELGGELRLNGSRMPGRKPLKIGIEAPHSPFDNDTASIYIIPPAGAVTTSGVYRRSYQQNAKRISHIIDPRTGHSADNELLSVTVYANDAITADAYDNALMVMGLKPALEFAERQPQLEAYFIYLNKSGQLSDTATTGFYKWIVR